MAEQVTYKLPSSLPNYKSTLAKLYDSRGQTELAQIVRDSQWIVEVGMDYDNWNGGTYGHYLNIYLDEATFLSCFDSHEGYEKRIEEDLNKIAAKGIDEYISRTSIRVLTPDTKVDGLDQSSLVRAGEEDLQTIWGGAHYLRAFASHKASHKAEVQKIADALHVRGVNVFVAHSSIKEDEVWQQSIEKALSSMDVLLAFITPDFSDSDWTDQEVGIAIGRGIPVFPINLGKDPYGFIGRYQARPLGKLSNFEMARSIHDRIMKHERTSGMARRKLFDCLLHSSFFNMSQRIMNIIDYEKLALSETEAEILIRASTENDQVYRSGGVVDQIKLVLERNGWKYPQKDHELKEDSPWSQQDDDLPF